MHNPALIGIPRPLPLPLPPFGRHVASDYIPIDVTHQHPPPIYLSHRQPSRYRTHHAFSGNQFYNRTKRKRDSSNTGRTNAPLENGHQQHHQQQHHVANGVNQQPQPAPNQGRDDEIARRTFKATPWNQSNNSYTEGIIGLHEEIEAFVQWMVPTASEHELRLSVINRLRAAIREIYPAAIVQIFGSFRTGLYLPTSDIDLVLVGNWDQIPFEIVRSGIEAKNLAKPGSLQLLEHATVPIIKMTDRLTDIKVDISFNMTNGLRSVELIKHYKKRFPAMAKLIYVLKQFLLQRDLNEVYTGGLSSYALILMVVSFLQLHPRGEKAGSEKANLGVLLIEFFELYGRHFNYCNTAIKIIDGGAYVSKDELRGLLAMGTGLGSLCIQDPYLPENDVGKSSYGIPVVKTAFEQAYLTLKQLVEQGSPAPEDGESILSQVVRVSEDVINFRRWVASSTATPRSLAETPSSISVRPQLTTSTPISGSGKSNNDDQTLSEDPRLPSHITPTPSRDVLPRELPLKVFSGKNSSEVGNRDEVITVSVVGSKDNDNMSGVSTATSSESNTSQTDTDSDVLVLGGGSASSPSGSPSSAMSISPASSEVGGIRNNNKGRSLRNGNGQRQQQLSSDVATDNNSKFKQPTQPGSTSRGSGRYWNTGNGSSSSSGNPHHRKTGAKERSDLVLNWRNAGPDKNNDWRNHEPPSRPDRKNSWRDEPGRGSDKSRGNSDESSCGEEKVATSSKNSGKTGTSSKEPEPERPREQVPNRDPDEIASRVAADTLSKPSDITTSTAGPNIPATVASEKQQLQQADASSSCGSHKADEPNFVKSRTFSNKKRKKQRQNKNRNNSNGTTAAAIEAVPEPVKSVEVAATVSNSERNSSPQNRFSNKSGRSKPNR